MFRTKISTLTLTISTLLITPNALASNKKLDAAINDVQSIFTEWAGGRIERLGHYENLVVEGIRSQSIKELEKAILVLDNNHFDKSTVSRTDLAQMVDKSFSGSDNKVARLLLEASSSVELSERPMSVDQIVLLALYELIMGDDNNNDEVLVRLLDRTTLSHDMIHDTWTTNKGYIKEMTDEKTKENLSVRTNVLSSLSAEIDKIYF